MIYGHQIKQADAYNTNLDDGTAKKILQPGTES